MLHTQILAPDGAADWVFDRDKLWNTVEACEKHPRAQLAREVELALPHQLSQEQNLALLRQYVTDQFVSRGMVADFAIHEGHTDKRNVHAHVMLTMRKLTPDGFGNKVREWNEIKNVRQWREAWSRYQNDVLRDAGHAVRVDHRSYRDRDIEKIAQIHEGPKARRMHERGYEPGSGKAIRRSWNNKARRVNYQKTDQGRTRAQRNQQIAWVNKVRRDSGARVTRLVEVHLHHRQLAQAWSSARDAGKELGKLSQRARRDKDRLQRTARSLADQRRHVRETLEMIRRINGPVPRIEVYLAYQLLRLESGAQQFQRQRQAADRQSRKVQRAAIRYRNLKSRLGRLRAEKTREQVRRSHEQALRDVRPFDIQRSSLSNAQKDDLTRSWKRARSRSRSDEHSDR